jgi:hypothetical protein
LIKSEFTQVAALDMPVTGAASAVVIAAEAAVINVVPIVAADAVALFEQKPVPLFISIFE